MSNKISIEKKDPYISELRDRFAIAALTGLLHANGRRDDLNFAVEAYALADEMLKARAHDETQR